MKPIFVATLLVCLCGDASARDADGALQTILFPNEGRPAVALAGDTFTALATHEAGLSLRDGDLVVPLHTVWRRVPGAMVAAECRVPPECRPGTYAIASDDSDVNLKSVSVLSAAPESYDVAHIAAPRFGAGDAAALPESVDARSPALVVVSGDVTANGTAAEMNQALEFARSIHAPTLFTPGPSDDRNGQFTRYFGPPVYALRFGEDAYMSVGVDAMPREELYGPMYRARRGVRDARWTVGLASVDPIQWPMRAQLALFVDDPLDFLLIPGNEEQVGEVRWGSTIYLQTPIDTMQWRLLRVEPFTPSPGELISTTPETEEVSTSIE